MPDFNFNLFTQSDQYEETPLRDRKAFIEYWKNLEKAEFLRDVIGLANTARMMGKPAYLILGIRNIADGTSDDICGIGEMYERQIGQGRTELQSWETMRQELAAAIQRYITPLFSPDIQFNKIDGKVVGYVLIPPLTGKPFQSREFRQGGQTYLREGQCWLRFGESKIEIAREELAPNSDKLIYSYAEVPYVLSSIWREYFSSTVSELDKRWIEFSKPDESAYQSLRTDRNLQVDDIWVSFLNGEDSLLVVQGEAGCGKTLFLEKKIYALVEQGINDTDLAIANEEYRPSKEFVPLFFRLRDIGKHDFRNSERFVSRVCSRMSILWHNTFATQKPSHPEKLLDNQRIKWLVVLDGLDEIGSPQDRSNFVKILHGFALDYPHVKIVLSARNRVTLDGEFSNSQVLKIAPLDALQIKHFLLSYRTDRNEEEIFKFVNECEKYADLWKLLSTPVYLNEAANYLNIPTVTHDAPANPDAPVFGAQTVQDFPENSNREIAPAPAPFDTELFFDLEKPISNEKNIQQQDEQENTDDVHFSPPRLLDRIYTAFWEREERRKRFENIQRLRTNTYFLAVRMQDKSEKMEWDYARKRISSISGLNWVLEMGVLSDDESSVFFLTPSTQIYAAAKSIQWRIQCRPIKALKDNVAMWKKEYFNDVELFFFELTEKRLNSVLYPQGETNG